MAGAWSWAKGCWTRAEALFCNAFNAHHGPYRVLMYLRLRFNSSYHAPSIDCHSGAISASNTASGRPGCCTTVCRALHQVVVWSAICEIRMLTDSIQRFSRGVKAATWYNTSLPLSLPGAGSAVDRRTAVVVENFLPPAPFPTTVTTRTTSSLVVKAAVLHPTIFVSFMRVKDATT